MLFYTFFLYSQDENIKIHVLSFKILCNSFCDEISYRTSSGTSFNLIQSKKDCVIIPWYNVLDTRIINEDLIAAPAQVENKW